MQTQEVPHYEWTRFFDEFSRRHQAWLVTVEMTGQSIGHQVQVRDLPFEGITVEPNEIGEDEITITPADGPKRTSLIPSGYRIESGSSRTMRQRTRRLRLNRSGERAC